MTSYRAAACYRGSRSKQRQKQETLPINSTTSENNNNQTLAAPKSSWAGLPRGEIPGCIAICAIDRATFQTA